jgi:hypothetical protein
MIFVATGAGVPLRRFSQETPRKSGSAAGRVPPSGRRGGRLPVRTRYAAPFRDSAAAMATLQVHTPRGDHTSGRMQTYYVPTLLTRQGLANNIGVYGYRGKAALSTSWKTCSGS